MHKHYKTEHKTKHRSIDKGVVCQLINASIEDESKAGNEYTEILEHIPHTEEFEECSEAITKIMEDEINHAVTLIRISKALGCKKPELSEEDEAMYDIVNHVHKIKIK